jgi:hypothetical protein
MRLDGPQNNSLRRAEEKTVGPTGSRTTTPRSVCCNITFTLTWIFVQRATLWSSRRQTTTSSVLNRCLQNVPLQKEASHTCSTLFTTTLSRNKKSPNIFKLATRCNVVLKIKANRSKNRLTWCHNCQCSVNAWVQCTRPTRCLWYKSDNRYRKCDEKQNSDCVSTCCNCDLNDGEQQHPVS